MYILGYDWFRLVWEFYNTSDLWKRENWIGLQQTAYDLGIFVWVIIGIIALIIICIVVGLIWCFIIEYIDIKNKYKNK